MEKMNNNSKFKFDVHVISDISAPFKSGTDANDYSCFQMLKERYGIYVFLEKTTGEIMYIGEAHSQDLKTRICQNYTEKNTGGTFRINWCDKNNTFQEFKEFLSKCELKIISIDTESKDLIRALEAILISALRPLFNK